MRTVVSQTSRWPVAAYDSYAEVQRAVDHLSDQGFPVGKVAIIGHGLRYVEQVTGRYTTGRAALVGALEGAPLGAFLGLLMGVIFTYDPNPAVWLLVLYGLAVGALIGAGLGAGLHLATGDARLLVGAWYAGRALRGGSRRGRRRPGGQAAALGRLSRAA